MGIEGRKYPFLEYRIDKNTPSSERLFIDYGDGTSSFRRVTRKEYPKMIQEMKSGSEMMFRSSKLKQLRYLDIRGLEQAMKVFPSGCR